MKHCLVLASLISPSKMILFEKKYQTFDTVFHHQMKHLKVRQKYSAARRIFNSLLGVSSGDETLHLIFDILLPEFSTLLRFKQGQESKLIFENDAIRNRISNDFDKWCICQKKAQ